MAIPPRLFARKLSKGTHLVLTAGIIGAAALGGVPAAQAEPGPSIGQVQARINALNDRADVAVEAYSQATLALAAARLREATAMARVARAQGALRGARAQMASFVSAAYRTGGTDAVISLVNSSSPQTFLDQVSALDRLAAGQAAHLASVATARHRLASLEADAASSLTDATALAGQVAAQQRIISAALNDQKALLHGLQADQLRQLLAAQAWQRARDAQAAARAAASGQYRGPASGQAGVAVREAYRLLGDDYVWGAAGPTTFDCSGLTMWVWAKAGVSLTHSAAAQYDEARHVAQADLQPGDLTFYGSPIHHVGIYVGGGQMISAPHTGDVVKIQDAFRSDFVGGARP